MKDGSCTSRLRRTGTSTWTKGTGGPYWSRRCDRSKSSLAEARFGTGGWWCRARPSVQPFRSARPIELTTPRRPALGSPGDNHREGAEAIREEQDHEAFSGGADGCGAGRSLAGAKDWHGGAEPRPHRAGPHGAESSDSNRG